jgi:serine/threonine-protein kinase
MIGERLGNWVLQSEIGQGGMGRVYLAREDAQAARTAAIKVLTAALAADAGFLVRFQREAEILRRLHHPNIVSYYDDGAHRGHAWIAMEYVDGPTCEDMLQRRGRLPWQEVLNCRGQPRAQARATTASFTAI